MIRQVYSAAAAKKIPHAAQALIAAHVSGNRHPVGQSPWLPGGGAAVRYDVFRSPHGIGKDKAVGIALSGRLNEAAMKQNSLAARRTRRKGVKAV